MTWSLQKYTFLKRLINHLWECAALAVLELGNRDYNTKADAIGGKGTHRAPARSEGKGSILTAGRSISVRALSMWTGWQETRWGLPERALHRVCLGWRRVGLLVTRQACCHRSDVWHFHLGSCKRHWTLKYPQNHAPDTHLWKSIGQVRWVRQLLQPVGLWVCRAACE